MNKYHAPACMTSSSLNKHRQKHNTQATLYINLELFDKKFSACKLEVQFVRILKWHFKFASIVVTAWGQHIHIYYLLCAFIIRKETIGIQNDFLLVALIASLYNNIELHCNLKKVVGGLQLSNSTTPPPFPILPLSFYLARGQFNFIDSNL